MNLSILMIFLSIKVERFDKKKMANQYNNLANKDKCYPNPVPACIGKENDSGLIRLADFFPDPDMSFCGICKFCS